jgi:hypothetical protein
MLRRSKELDVTARESPPKARAPPGSPSGPVVAAGAIDPHNRPAMQQVARCAGKSVDNHPRRSPIQSWRCLAGPGNTKPGRRAKPAAADNNCLRTANVGLISGDHRYFLAAMAERSQCGSVRRPTCRPSRPAPSMPRNIGSDPKRPASGDRAGPRAAARKLIPQGSASALPSAVGGVKPPNRHP